MTGTGQIKLSLTDGVGQTIDAAFTVNVLARTYHLAEGATGPFFSTDLLLSNPNSQPAHTMITFFKEDGSTVVLSPTLAATSRTTIRVGDVAGMESTAFSTIVESLEGLPIVVERTMFWDTTGYGSHTEKASAGPALTWNFAEGSQGYFHTYFLLLNPNATATTAHVAFQHEGAAPVTRDYVVPATSRRTIDCAAEPALANQSFGAVITFDAPGMAERAMYFGDAPLFSGGHDSAGVETASTSWFLAEGATGSFFDTFVLFANPGDTTANVTVKYLPASGVPITKTFALPGHQRHTINISTEDPALASAAVSTQVNSDVPIVVERSQYWPHGGWYEAHNSMGETSPGQKWGLAEGRVGGTNNAQTYILVANPNTTPADVTATFLRVDGTTVVKHFTVPATSRFNISVVSGGGDVPELANESFGTVIEATQPVMVERSFYTDAGGVTWAAGTNATATRLP